MRIAIIANYRTASTSFTLKKAEEYGVPYKGEMFSDPRPYDLGEARAKWQLINSPWKEMEKYQDPVEREACISHERFIEQLEAGHPCCFKLIPIQVRNEEHVSRILNAVDRIYYLYRRDFRAQCESWVAVRQDGNFGGTGFKRNVRDYLRNMTENQRQIHLATMGKEDEPYRITVDLEDQPNFGENERAFPLIRGLVERYEEMAKMYKEFPGELVCMEDYFKGETYNPYNREITWVKPMPMPEQYENFNVESLFKEKG